MELDIQKASNLLENDKYLEAEEILSKYLNLPFESLPCSFWYNLGICYRKQSRLNEANAALINATNSKEPFNTSFYELGRLHGESISFHRSHDISASHFKKNPLQKSKDIIYSCFGEQKIIHDILSELPSIENYCIDIGAGDGLTFSNTYNLFKNDWKGLCAEVNSEAFSNLAKNYQDFENVNLFKGFVTPDNVKSLFQLNSVPKNFGVLSLDIDSYDYYVLKEILKEYKPVLMCVEICEVCPPPIRFTLKYPIKTDMYKNGLLQLFGQSICMLNDLLLHYNYSLIQLEYNNAFILRNDYINYLKTFKVITPEEAYQTGLLNKNDYHLKLFWSYKNINLMQNTPIEQRVQFLKNTLQTQNKLDSYICY